MDSDKRKGDVTFVWWILMDYIKTHWEKLSLPYQWAFAPINSSGLDKFRGVRIQ